MKIIAKKDFTVNGVYYFKGDEIKVTSKESLIKLNEIGFIEPLSRKEIELYFRKDKEEK